MHTHCLEQVWEPEPNLYESVSYPQMSPINLEDATSFLFAIPFGTAHLVSTIGSPMHCYYTKRKKKNKQQKNKFHQIFPFLAHHLRDLPCFTLVGSVLLARANTFE